MTIIARFSVDVPFGKKQDLFALEAKWGEVHQKLGFPKGEVLVGSIGVPESRVEFNYKFESLAALEAVFVKVGKEPNMAAYQKDMAPLIVPGSHRWDILRVQS